MTRGVGSALVLVFAFPATAAAGPISDHVRLNPARSAVDYSRSIGHDLQPAWTNQAAPLRVSNPVPDEVDYRVPLVPDHTPKSPPISESLTHEVQSSGLTGRLRKLRDKLFIEVTAYEAGNTSKRWEGLDGAGEANRGRTLDVGDGRFRGDLSVGIGAAAGVASLSDLTSGSLRVLDLNPIRDVSAQFDFLVRVGAVERGGGFDAFIVRVRAVYLDAFRRSNDDTSATTEYTLSVGLSW